MFNQFDRMGDKILHVEVIGMDRLKGQYRLPVVQIVKDDYNMSTKVYVELPFDPDHRIWPELEGSTDETSD